MPIPKWRYVHAADLAWNMAERGHDIVTITVAKVDNAVSTQPSDSGTITSGTITNVRVRTDVTPPIGPWSRCGAFTSGIRSAFVYNPADVALYDDVGEGISSAWSRDMGNLDKDLRQVIGTLYERRTEEAE